MKMNAQPSRRAQECAVSGPGRRAQESADPEGPAPVSSAQLGTIVRLSSSRARGMKEYMRELGD
jgi:hypothetical protein